MAGFNTLSVRDLVALTFIGTRQGAFTLSALAASVSSAHDVVADTAHIAAAAAALVASAFAVADEFVKQSEGKWADGARANHQAKVGRVDRGDKPPG